MKPLNFDYKIIKSDKNFISLKITNNYNTLPGLLITIGNSLRRILLNNLMGTAIISFCINKPNNDSVFLQSTKEDVFEISSNIKKIVLRSSKLGSFDAQLSVKGPAVVTAGDLKVPENIIINNPNLYLFTLTNAEVVELVFKIEQGTGYKFYNERYLPFEGDSAYKHLDANFSPVLKVNYKVLLEESLLFENKMVESLLLEIWTNGSITPIRAFLEGNKILASVFTNLIK